MKSIELQGRLKIETSRKRQLKNNAKGFDRWRLYEILKDSNLQVDNDTIAWVEGMNETELREGIIEWLLTRNRNQG